MITWITALYPEAKELITKLNLKQNNTELKDVLIMTCQEKNNFSLVRIDKNE
jgi:hypothetical protein